MDRIKAALVLIFVMPIVLVALQLGDDLKRR